MVPFGCVLLLLLGLLCQGGEGQRPVWNIAHMVNARHQADYYLNAGANSLEFDISFNKNGEAEYTHHGVPCDCFRTCTHFEKFEVFIEYMRQLTTPGSPKYRKELILLFMDFKLSSLSAGTRVRAGSDVAKKLIEFYWIAGKEKEQAHILISVPSVNHQDFITSFRETLKSEGYSEQLSKIGFDFSANEDLDAIDRAYQNMGITERIWQGDGITNCLLRGTGRLTDAVQRRDKPGSNLNKVYWWTVDKMKSIRSTLRLNVDGMISNYPERVVQVLQEKEFSGRFRMATREDNPWERYASSAPLHFWNGRIVL